MNLLKWWLVRAFSKAFGCIMLVVNSQVQTERILTLKQQAY